GLTNRGLRARTGVNQGALGGLPRPAVITRRGRPADRGYKIERFEIVFRHYLRVEIEDILRQRRGRKKRGRTGVRVAREFFLRDEKKNHSTLHPHAREKRPSRANPAGAQETGTR